MDAISCIHRLLDQSSKQNVTKLVTVTIALMQ